jgi:hypothetical protein
MTFLQLVELQRKMDAPTPLQYGLALIYWLPGFDTTGLATGCSYCSSTHADDPGNLYTTKTSGWEDAGETRGTSHIGNTKYTAPCHLSNQTT